MGKIKVCFVDTIGLVYKGDTLKERGLGGSESAIILLSQELVNLGMDVTVFNRCEREGDYNGVRYLDLSRIKDNREFFDIMISSRSCIPYIPIQFKDGVVERWGVNPADFVNLVSNVRHKVVWMHDTFCDGEEWLEHLLVDGYINELFTLSDWHTNYVSNSAHGHEPRHYEQLKHKIWQTRNGLVNYIKEVDIDKKDKNLFIYNASVSKGMVPLLTQCWPMVREHIPQAKLKIIGGFYRHENPDELERQFNECYDKHHGKNGVEFTGIIKQDEVAKIFAKASFFIYPAIYPETYGISTIEGINYNTPVVGCRFGALEEVAAEKTSYLIDYPFNYDKGQLERFIYTVLEAYNNDYLRQQKMYACNAFKPWLTWDTVALQWKQHFCRILNIPMDTKELHRVRQINSTIVRLFNRRHLNPEDIFEDYSGDYPKHRMVVVSPAYNAEDYIEKCIRSVASQDYENYIHYIIDDMSTDNTVSKVKEVISSLPKYLRDRFVLVENTEKRYAIGNQLHVMREHAQPNDVIVLLDGDDWLVNDSDVFNYINRQYIEGKWMTYGSCHSAVDNIDLISQPYPEEVHDSNGYREHLFNWGMPYTHLRTFKRFLINHINDKDFRDEDGEYFKAGGDNALFYPIIELCPKDRIGVIQRILYIYNDASPLNDYKVNETEQNEVAKYIRSLKPYQSIRDKVRILIAIPTAKNIETDTFINIYHLDKPDKAEVDFQCFYGYNIDQVRNLVAHYTIKNGYDYVFCVDSDIILPQDALVKLLSHQKDIVSGVYIQRRPGLTIPEVYIDNEHGGADNAHPDTLRGSGIIEVAGCGFGCVLVSRKVLEDVGYPQFTYHSSIDFDNTVSEDVDFCMKAKAKGYKVYVDCAIKCGHIGSTVHTLG